MKPPSFADGYEILCLQAGDNGRADVLFGDSYTRARKLVRPFMVGKDFPSVYLEFPLAGDPFLDITVLYGDLAPHTRIDSPAAAGSQAMLDWFASICDSNENVCCGFELDTKHDALPLAGVHLQPRNHTDLVRPFCESIGEPERADLYLHQAQRMSGTWPLSFFGLFRGRPSAPLRVCGYLPPDERKLCAKDPQHTAEVFDTVGFTAYDDAMLAQLSQLLDTDLSYDFQFDVYPDGRLGNTFAIDIHFDSRQYEGSIEHFKNGTGSYIMHLLESWGATDERWHLGIESTFARSIPVELDDGSIGKYAITLMPQWLKVRWIGTELQASKFYLFGKATTMAAQ